MPTVIRLMPASAAVFAVAVGTLVIVGWTLDVATLTSLLPGHPPMPLTTAATLLLSGGALWLRRRPDAGPTTSRVAAIGSTAVAAAGVLAVLGYSLGWNPRAFVTADSLAGSRMSPISAAAFAGLGAGLALMNHRTRRGASPAEWLFVLVLFLTMVPLVGFVYDAIGLLDPLGVGPITIHAAVALAVLAAGGLCARPDRGMVALVFGASHAGWMLRWLLPATVVCLVLSGAIQLLNARRFGNEAAFGIAGAVAINIAVLCGLLVWAGGALRRTELAAEAGAAREAHILESISDGFVALDRNWRYIYVNIKAGDLLGRPAASLIGRHIWTEFPDGVGQPFHRMYEKAMAERVPITFEDYYAPFERWFENRIYPIDNGIAIYFSEITERKRAELALRYERDFSDAALTSLPGVLYMYDRDLRFLRWNRNFERVTGYTREEIVGMSPLEFFAAADRPLVAARIEQVFTLGESSVEADFVSRDGTRTPYYFTGVRTQIAETVCLIGVGMDITARRRAEDALRRSEERLRLALDAAHMGTFDWDLPVGRITWSRWHEELWGFAPGEFDGTYAAFERRVHPDDRPAIAAAVERSRAAHTAFAEEFRVVWPDGSVHWISGRGEFATTEGSTEHMRGVVMEVTDRKRREEEAVALTNDLRALSEHLRTVREAESTRIARELHDELGQALTGLRFDASHVARQLAAAVDEHRAAALRDRMDALLRQIDATVHTVRRMATELRPGILDDLGLSEAIEWQAQEFARRTGIPCATNIVPLDARDGDPARATALFRILLEALTNVARHAGAGAVAVTLERTDGDIVLEVRDDGRGIDEQEARHSRSLGLVGMRERAIALGGEVTVTAASPRGTRVVARLPWR